MKVTLEEVDKVTSLARLTLKSDEKQRLAKEMSQILDYVEKINELDTSQVEATAHILDIRNVMREDENKECLSVQQVTGLAPKSKNDMIVVPQVI